MGEYCSYVFLSLNGKHVSTTTDPAARVRVDRTGQRRVGTRSLLGAGLSEGHDEFLGAELAGRVLLHAHVDRASAAAQLGSRVVGELRRVGTARAGYIRAEEKTGKPESLKVAVCMRLAFVVHQAANNRKGAKTGRKLAWQQQCVLI